ncbi:MAG: LacI family DNA-binding transcriptional regulator [Spirochaetota bacterium]
MKKPTLQDVAEAAGISIAAVSQILASKGRMSPEVSERVKALAEEMGYRKSSRSGGGTRRFKYVCILQREDHPYLWNFSQPFASHLEEHVIRMGYYPIILHVDTHATERTLLKEIQGARVGAVFSIHYAQPELFLALEGAGIPVILVNNSEFQTQFYSVLADEVQGSFEATSHLIGLGHRTISYADYHRPRYPTLINDRFFGYWKALEERGLEYLDENRISVELDDYEGLVKRVAAIFDSRQAPTAFTVHDDYFAGYIFEALRKIGKRIPEDVSLIATGGDVLDYSIPFNPKISTMQIDQRHLVSMAWGLLVSRLQALSGSAETLPEPVRVLKTKMPFKDRGSCMPIRA